jgi:hypothetical protein
MYNSQGWQNNKTHDFPSKRYISKEKGVIMTHFTMKIIRTYLYKPCNKKILFVKKYLSLLWVLNDFSFLLVAFWTHTHCDNAATNSNSENAISKMVGKFAGKRGYGDKGRWVKYRGHSGCWISPCYSLFWLGARFETYGPFISLIFQIFFSVVGKLLIRVSAFIAT